MPFLRAVTAFSFAFWGGTLFGQALSFLPPVNVYNSGYSRATSMCESCVATADFNNDGKVDFDGLAAASAVRIAADGNQTPVNVTSCTGQVCTSEPIDLSGQPVYLSLYGTGFTQASTESSSCAIAGQTLPETYAGPQMQIAGLDQINVLLPRSLQGTGETFISCSVGPSQPAVVSNAVKLRFR